MYCIKYGEVNRWNDENDFQMWYPRIHTTIDLEIALDRYRKLHNFSEPPIIRFGGTVLLHGQTV